MNLTPKGLVERMERSDLPVALVFGREDIGLLNTELEICDIGVTIPAYGPNPVMNLSHAVAVILYEIYSRELDIDFKRATSDDKERMIQHFTNLLDSINYPEHRKEHSTIMFRRLLGRASPTTWEFHTLIGIFKRASHLIEKDTDDDSEADWGTEYENDCTTE